MHNDINTAVEEFYTPRTLSAQPNKTYPTDIIGADTTPTKTPRDNDATPPLMTQPSSPNSPSVDSPEDPAFPPPFTLVDAGTTARLKSESDLEEVFLTAADGVLFGVYQYWVHQNPVTHLYGVIHEGVKWQVRCKNLCVFLPNSMMYSRFVSVKVSS